MNNRSELSIEEIEEVRNMNNKIKCPNCGEIIELDDKNYSRIVAEVRTDLFEKEVRDQVSAVKREQEALFEARMSEKENKHNQELAAKDQEIAILEEKAKNAETDKKQEVEAARMKTENQWQKILGEKEQEIYRLQEEAKSAEERKKIAIAEAEQQKDREIGRLKLDLEKNKHEAEKLARDQQDAYKRELAEKDAEIARLNDYRLRQTTKMVGENLEVYCKREFDSVRMMGFPNAYFEKDNDDRGGSKADFVYREEMEDGTPLLSITFEMKNEMDATATKHKNEDFLKKLDDDRKKNCTEYAVLVTMLEQDNEYYNKGIVVAYKYKKMYIVRPQFFIQLIFLLRDAALNSQQVRRELMIARQQNVDVQNFESNLLEAKGKFDKYYKLASDNFDDAIKRIDASIKDLEKVKESLLGSKRNIRLANDKLQDMSIKKLTKDSPSVRQMYIEAGSEIK